MRCLGVKQSEAQSFRHGAMQTESQYVCTHAAEPKARPFSKMWQYLATEQHCCTLLKSNFKGYNLLGQVMTPSASLPSSDDNYAVSWSTEYSLDYLFILYKSLLWLVREGEWRSRDGGRDTDRDGESERGYAWNGVRGLRSRQICLVELQMHFLFTCLCMPWFQIVFPCHFYCSILSHNSPVLCIMSILRIYLCDIIQQLFQIASLSRDSYGAL